MSNPRKTAALAAASIRTGPATRRIDSFAAARALLRSDKVAQAGAGADLLDRSNPDAISLFYIDGASHRRRRTAIARYFSQRTIEDRYEPIMARTADRLLAAFRATGVARLDQLTFQFAVAIAAEILGLDFSDLAGLSARIAATIAPDDSRLPTRGAEDAALRRFNAIDVDPAIAARRERRREDVISSLIDDGCTDDFIRTEVRGFALAGMITTREFIAMAAWHLLDRPDWAECFIAGDPTAQIAMLAEILRLDPVIGMLKRRTTEDLDLPGEPTIAAGTLVAIDIRAANGEASIAGACPFQPNAAQTHLAADVAMSFGDGPHRCPGAQLALHEARIFLTRLLAIPGLRMASIPQARWFRPITSYELHDFAIACDRT